MERTKTPATRERAPDFVLPDSEGTPTRLSQLVREKPVALLFYRGDW